MPWKEATVFALRQEFVHFADRPETNMSQLCRRFGISRKTGYKWLHRWRQAGAAGLRDQSRRPQTSPRQTPPPVEEAVLAVQAQ
ncbi:MAG TPA: leucine zipper domain-containing protein, partial [bacterium]|nr:leucine zipper domain-containing protein [bacterium]